MSVLDLWAAALAATRARLGDRAAAVTWLEADITRVELPRDAYDIWHDRAVFHFLTEAAERDDYRASLRRSLEPGGSLVVATFGPDGPVTVAGDYYIVAVPLEVMGRLLRQERHRPILQADPGLEGIIPFSKSIAWMNGLQLYLKRDVSIIPGHTIYSIPRGRSRAFRRNNSGLMWT